MSVRRESFLSLISLSRENQQSRQSLFNRMMDLYILCNHIFMTMTTFRFEAICIPRTLEPNMLPYLYSYLQERRRIATSFLLKEESFCSTPAGSYTTRRQIFCSSQWWDFHSSRFVRVDYEQFSHIWKFRIFQRTHYIHRKNMGTMLHA